MQSSVELPRTESRHSFFLNPRFPQDMEREVVSFLSTHEKVALASSATGTRALAAPEIQLDRLCLLVVQGKQDLADELLASNSPAIQKLMLRTNTFKDPAGRVFTCSAPEYAYWALDTNMCKMLFAHMDACGQAVTLARCSKIKTLGLTYKQNGFTFRQSKHFDFTRIICALEKYTIIYEPCCKSKSWTAIRSAWLAIGRAQCDLPDHVIHEYCRSDRSFYYRRAADDEHLPRESGFLDCRIGEIIELLPRKVGLGVDFAINRGILGIATNGQLAGLGSPTSWLINIDLIAMRRLSDLRLDDRLDLERILAPHESFNLNC